MQTFKMWTKKLKHKQTNKQTPMYKQSKQHKTKISGQTSKWKDTIYFKKWEISNMKCPMLLNQPHDSSHTA